jgi:hypothetical protein
MQCDLLTSLRFGTLGAAIWLASCDRESDARHEEPIGDAAIERQFTQKTVANEGSVCLAPSANGAVQVDVVFSACLSSSCDRADGATCTAEVDNGRLLVSSQLTFTSEMTPNLGCDDDCRPIKVACGVLQPAGTVIRVVHGSAESETVALPLSEVLQFSGETSSVGAGVICEVPIDTYFQ